MADDKGTGLRAGEPFGRQLGGFTTERAVALLVLGALLVLVLSRTALFRGALGD